MSTVGYAVKGSVGDIRGGECPETLCRARCCPRPRLLTSTARALRGEAVRKPGCCRPAVGLIFPEQTRPPPQAGGPLKAGVQHASASPGLRPESTAGPQRPELTVAQQSLGLACGLSLVTSSPSFQCPRQYVVPGGSSFHLSPRSLSASATCEAPCTGWETAVREIR